MPLLEIVLHTTIPTILPSFAVIENSRIHSSSLCVTAGMYNGLIVGALLIASSLLCRGFSMGRSSYFGSPLHSAIDQGRTCSRKAFLTADHLPSQNDLNLASPNAELLSRLQGTPELMDYLLGLAQTHSGIEADWELYRRLYPFPIDSFQERSTRLLMEGSNVVVMTPTGSGKTLVGELAIYHALMLGKRVVYTTPLKALSNQKFLDFCTRFGADRVSLCTGDLVLNNGAPLTVMTTEIFRNQLYSPDRDGRRRRENLFSNVHAVVFDEFHYMNDGTRGTVWEESIISCPPSIRILALSATMGNAHEICEWMTHCHRNTSLVTSEYRPVPLKYSFAVGKRLFPFFEDPHAGPGGKTSQIRASTGKGFANKKRIIDSWKLHSSILKNEKSLAQRIKLLAPKHGRSGGRDQSFLSREQRETLRRYCPSYADVAVELKKSEKLPAIFFIFSRARCEEAAMSIGRARLQLTTMEEQREISEAVANFVRKHPTIPLRKQSIRLLHAGIAVHHAGLIPVWKQFIEELFAKNKIKVLFATETLAAGVNMPARTTVITSVSKRIQGENVHLRTSELLQMAGRAGRRGKDVEGSVVFMRNEKEPPSVAHKMLLAPIDSVSSNFRASYSLAIKMLRTRSLDACKELVGKSFGTFLQNKQKVLDNQKDQKERLPLLDNVDNATVSDLDIDRYRVVLQKYSLNKCSHFDRSLRRIQRKREEKLRIERLAQDGDQERDSDSADSPLSTDEYYTSLCRGLQDMERAYAKHPIVVAGDEEVAIAAIQFSRRLKDPRSLLSNDTRTMEFRQPVAEKDQSNIQNDPPWQAFLDVVKVLQEYKALDQNHSATLLGNVTASLATENELWVTLVLSNPAVYDLDPHQLGALLACVQIDEFRASNNVFKIEISEKMQNVTAALSQTAEDLEALQDEHSIDFPVSLCPEMFGVAESWSRGSSWANICSKTSLEQGDLHRTFKRTSDLLKEIYLSPFIDPSLRRKAAQAALSFGRFPVTNEDNPPPAIVDMDSVESIIPEDESSQMNSKELEDFVGGEESTIDTAPNSEDEENDENEDFLPSDTLIGDSSTLENLDKLMEQFLLAPRGKADKQKAANPLNGKKREQVNKYSRKLRQ